MLRPFKRAAASAYDGIGAQLFGRGRVQACDVRGHRIRLVTESALERFRANTYETKEPETLDWIERYFRPGDVLYDVGANIGLYSVFAAMHLGRRCRVYAFEPEGLNHADLGRNIHLNGLSGVVVPCCLAVSDQLSFNRLYVNPTSLTGANGEAELMAGSALHAFGAPEDFRGRSFTPVHEQGAVGVPIDHLWDTWALDFPNHIKIDVDGGERRVIAGASRTLADPRLKSVLIELSADTPHEHEILEALGRSGLVQVTDFAAHSSAALVGTDYEGCVNRVFLRP